MVLIAQLLLYFAALAGVLGASLGAFYFAGGALSRARPGAYRLTRGVLAVLCLCGIVASAVLGFVGIPAIVYLAQQ